MWEPSPRTLSIRSWLGYSLGPRLIMFTMMTRGAVRLVIVVLGPAVCLLTPLTRND